MRCRRRAAACSLQARIADRMDSREGDVRDLESLRAAVREAQPEIVFHMAAQSLVRPSYEAPVETFATNVMGTAHLLEAVRDVPSVRSVVIVTSDKCYENDGRAEAFTESAAMGGHDPYSASKGCAELVTAAYARSFFADSHCTVASARAGNVIGGGDWAVDRIVPDLARAAESGIPAVIRRPKAVRPWQHVLEPLGGYLLLAHRAAIEGQSFAGPWNFGPPLGGQRRRRRAGRAAAAALARGRSRLSRRGERPARGGDAAARLQQGPDGAWVAA